MKDNSFKLGFVLCAPQRCAFGEAKTAQFRKKGMVI